jgi:FtsZ-interacting cell division protein YlmF
LSRESKRGVNFHKNICIFANSCYNVGIVAICRDELIIGAVDNMSYNIIKKALGWEEEPEEEIRYGPMPVVREHFRIMALEPQKFDDVKDAADAFLERAIVVLRFAADSDANLRRRSIDYMNGMGYALGAQVEKASENIVLYIPAHISLEKEQPRKSAKSRKWF